MSNIENVSRRNFLGGVFSTGALVLAARILPENAWADTHEYHGKAAGSALRPSIYLGVEAGWHSLHRHASVGDGHRHPDHAADGGGG